jgi:hypothetical protein
MPSVGTAAAAALPCDATVSVAKDISMNTIAVQTTAITGGSISIGCRRKAAAPLCVVVLTRSPAMATAMAEAESVGPWPMRALLRTRMSAARRCVVVSPGRR